MASVVIEFDAAHLQANKSAVRQSPDSTVQLCWYFTGCITKLNNPFWMEAKWWNSSQWPRPNHKQKKAFWCCCLFKVSLDCHDALLTAEHEIWARTDGALIGFFLNVWAHSRFTDLCFDCRGSLLQPFWRFVATIGKYLKQSRHQLLKSDMQSREIRFMMKLSLNFAVNHANILPTSHSV